MINIIERICIKISKFFWIVILDLQRNVEKLMQRVKFAETLEERVASLEARVPYIAICPTKPEEPEQNKQKQSIEKDDDEDIDLFDSEASEQRQ